jgi:O-antigen/teichoic acid export membrane protein
LGGGGRLLHNCLKERPQPFLSLQRYRATNLQSHRVEAILEQDLKPPANPTGLTRVSEQLSSLMRRYWNINWALADQAMISGANFLTGILLARYLGVTEFGIFALGWAVVELVQGIQSSVVVTPMMSIGPRQAEHERTDYVGSVVVQQAGFAALSTALFLSGIWAATLLFPDWNLEALTWSLGTAVLVSQFQNFGRRLFFTYGRSVLAFFVDFVRYAGQVVILFWLLRTIQMDAGRAFWVMSGTSLASTLLAVCFLERVSFSRDNLRVTFFRHWAFSKWLLLSELMRWATNNSYTFVAGSMIGAAGVGAIRATYNLLGLSNILTMGLENVVPPGAARRLRQGGKPLFLRYLRHVTLLGSCVVGAVSVIASAAPEFWLNLVYGKDYSGNGNLVVWWSVCYLIHFLAQQIGIGLRTIERTKSIFWAQFVTTIISVVSVYPLIYYFGLIGVMIGFLTITAVRAAILAYGFFNHLQKLEG